MGLIEVKFLDIDEKKREVILSANEKKIVLGYDFYRDIDLEFGIRNSLYYKYFMNMNDCIVDGNVSITHQLKKDGSLIQYEPLKFIGFN